MRDCVPPRRVCGVGGPRWWPRSPRYRAGVSRSVATSLTGHKTEAVYRRYAIVDSTAAGRRGETRPGAGWAQYGHNCGGRDTVTGLEQRTNSLRHQCPGQDSNLHGSCLPWDFKSHASTSFATRAHRKLIADCGLRILAGESLDTRRSPCQSAIANPQSAIRRSPRAAPHPRAARE